ncbi:MAG TPA: hypothetical protein IAB72_04680 [Candidatus Onthoplasma faecipullorum]|nr:hypothetical protein [Candidatus Onthoplasma faecipullorum]
MHKIISYLGFAKKSNNLIVGQSPIKRTDKKLYLILIGKSASENLENLAKNVANKHNCEHLKLNVDISELINLKDIKIVGITDYNLAKAIIENKENIIGER